VKKEACQATHEGWIAHGLERRGRGQLGFWQKSNPLLQLNWTKVNVISGLPFEGLLACWNGLLVVPNVFRPIAMFLECIRSTSNNIYSQEKTGFTNTPLDHWCDWGTIKGFTRFYSHCCLPRPNGMILIWARQRQALNPKSVRVSIHLLNMAWEVHTSTKIPFQKYARHNFPLKIGLKSHLSALRLLDWKDTLPHRSYNIPLAASSSNSQCLWNQPTNKNP